MVCAMLILPGIDAIAKLLGGIIPAGQIAWARFFFQVILLAPMVVWRRNLTFDSCSGRMLPAAS